MKGSVIARKLEAPPFLEEAQLLFEDESAKATFRRFLFSLCRALELEGYAEQEMTLAETRQMLATFDAGAEQRDLWLVVMGAVLRKLNRYEVSDDVVPWGYRTGQCRECEQLKANGSVVGWTRVCTNCGRRWWRSTDVGSSWHEAMSPEEWDRARAMLFAPVSSELA